jgi:hypothetical protein
MMLTSCYNKNVSIPSPLAKETALAVCGAKMMKRTGSTTTAPTVTKDGQRINEVKNDKQN